MHTDEELKLAKVRENFGRNSISYPLGIGVGFRGRSFLSTGDKSEGIALRTRWIVLFWLPLIPLGSYRIRMEKPAWNARGQRARNFELVSVEKLSIAQVLGCWAVSIGCIAVVWFVSTQFG
jgi:hypothetical protein